VTSAASAYSDAELDRLPKFAFWMPLEKSFVEKATGRRIIQGLASTPDLDAQGEVVLQKGIDFSPLLERGYINWNHQNDPASVIGVPLTAHITKSESHAPSLFVKACLYEGVQKADDAWNLARVLAKSREQGLPHRQLGWSVEGGTLQRANNFIARSVVRLLALTHEPVNYATFAELAKSLAAAGELGEWDGERLDKSASLDGATPLLLQNLAGGKKSAAEVCMALFGKKADNCQYEMGHFKKGRVGMFEHLVKCQGWPLGEAQTVVIGLHKSLTA
jgi:hypothetical protein